MSYSTFYSESWLTGSYEWIDFEEDSIKIEWKDIWFNLYWEEVKTYKRTQDSKWNKRKTTVDHAYIIYINILKHRFPIKSNIKIIPDIADS